MAYWFIFVFIIKKKRAYLAHFLRENQVAFLSVNASNAKFNVPCFRCSQCSLFYTRSMPFHEPKTNNLQTMPMQIWTYTISLMIDVAYTIMNHTTRYQNDVHHTPRAIDLPEIATRISKYRTKYSCTKRCS